MLAGYDKSSFEAPLASGHLVKHDVYTKGDGPVVVIIQELPGIGRKTLRLADMFVEQGFRVVLPHLFGPLGRISYLGNVARVFCMKREFNIFAKRKTSPIVDWLRALCQKLKADYNVEGVATIGMCLTGNFAISLMADDAVLASVASQPSLPASDHTCLHMSSQDVADIRARLDEFGPMKAYRFEKDKYCTSENFTAIDEAFNDDKERVQLTTIPGKGHAVLTLDFVNADGHPTRKAFDEIVEYFQSSLKAI